MKTLHLPDAVLYLDTIVSIAKQGASDIRIKYTYVYNQFGNALFGNMEQHIISFRNAKIRNEYFVELEKLANGINGIKPNLTVVEPLKPKS